MKILAVDDDELILDLLVAALADIGHLDVVPVSSPADAIDLVNALDSSVGNYRGSFDCILLDIQMPGMDGIELCERIRSIPSYSTTPILMVTSMSDRSYIDRAFAAGATDYITKPFDPVELGSRIRMAKTLVTEQRKALQAYFLASSIHTGLSDEDQAGFEAPIAVEGVAKVVDYLVLENYLLQLSKKKVHRTISIGFSIKEAREAYESLDESEFYEMLEETARAITKKFGDTKFLMSYFGSGYFVCVTDRSNANLTQSFSSSLSVSALQMEKTFGGIRPTIVVGDHTENSINRPDDIHTMLLESLSSVSKKMADTGDIPLAAKKLGPKAMRYTVSSVD